MAGDYWFVFLESSIRLSVHHSSEKQRQGSDFSHSLTMWELMKTRQNTHHGGLCLDPPVVVLSRRLALSGGGSANGGGHWIVLALSSWPFELESLPGYSSWLYCAVTPLRLRPWPTSSELSCTLMGPDLHPSYAFSHIKHWKKTWYSLRIACCVFRTRHKVLVLSVIFLYPHVNTQGEIVYLPAW